MKHPQNCQCLVCEDNRLADEIVFVNMCGQRVTRRVATNLFNEVCDKTNWKLPIDAVVTIYDKSTLNSLLRAITFFVGSVPTVEALGSNQYRVKAAGYYVDIGA